MIHIYHPNIYIYILYIIKYTLHAYVTRFFVYLEKSRKNKAILYTFRKMEVVSLQWVVTIYINEPMPS